MLFVLDTDHISLLQRGHQQVFQNFSIVDWADLAVTIVTVAEQVQGRLAVIRRARQESDAARGFRNLQRTVSFFHEIQVLDYNEEAVVIFEGLRQEKIRVGTQDLRIAAIAMTHQATLVSRNSRDFGRIPGLSLIDWSR